MKVVGHKSEEGLIRVGRCNVTLVTGHSISCLYTPLGYNCLEFFADVTLLQQPGQIFRSGSARFTVRICLCWHWQGVTLAPRPVDGEKPESQLYKLHGETLCGLSGKRGSTKGEIKEFLASVATMDGPVEEKKKLYIRHLYVCAFYTW